MIGVLLFLGCGSEPELPKGPDPAATRIAAENLCKLYQGAKLSCSVRPGGVTAEGLDIDVSARFDALEERTGIATFKGTVTLTADGKTWSTRMGGYGSRREEALDRGLHEWALLEGTAFVDAVRGDTGRAALVAVEPELAPVPLALDGRAVYRGWTLSRPPLEGGVPHEDLMRYAGEALDLDGGPHVLRIEVQRALEKMAYTCFLDGAPSEALCTAIQRHPWPEVRSWELRQTYVVPPA